VLREFSTNVVLVATATLLFYAALTDLREFKIRNNLVLALAGLYALYVVLAGEPWMQVLWHVGFAAAMFVVLLAFYARNWLGGGDVKILTVCFLWVGMTYALPFTILLLIFACGYVIMAEKFEWVRVLHTKRGRKVPYAPLVAAALICVFVLKFFVLKTNGI